MIASATSALATTTAYTASVLVFAAFSFGPGSAEKNKNTSLVNLGYVFFHPSVLFKTLQTIVSYAMTPMVL